MGNKILSVCGLFIGMHQAFGAPLFEKPSVRAARVAADGVYVSNPTGKKLVKIGGIRSKAQETSEVLGPEDQNAKISFTVELAIKDEDALMSRLETIYTKGHANFHKFYGTGEFQKRHEPTGKEKKNTIALMNKAGFKNTSSVGRHLTFMGTVKAVNALFNTQMTRYEDQNGESYVAPSHDLQVPSELGIASVVELGARPRAEHRGPIKLPEPLALNKKIFELKSLFSLPVANAVIPYNALFIRAMYGIPASLTGIGQTLGINGLPFDPKDIALFWTSLGYSYAQPPVTPVSIAGFPTNLNPGQADVETTVDITMALSMAPQLKEIKVYEGGATPYIAFNQAAIDNVVQTMTTSFAGEASFQQVAPMNTTLIQMAAQGQSTFVASGDSGSYPPQILDPMDQPYITSVGGAVKGSGYVNGVTPVYPGEGTWSQSGGGISPTWTIPSYQKAAAASNSQASQTMRNFPDVAAFSGTHYAPWYWIYVNGQNSGPWAGTSLSSPLWAAFTCLVNQNSAAQGLGRIGFLNPIVYEIGASSAYTTGFHDMADGTSNAISGYPGFTAITGYDLVTGWGTMNGAQLIPLLTSYVKPVGPVIPPIPLQCGNWLEQYNLVPFVSWGSMPSATQPEWNANGCNQQVCTFFVGKYGVVPNGSFGTLPANEQAIWTNVNCNWVLDPPAASSYPARCQDWKAHYKVVPGQSWGNLPLPDRYFWTLFNCDVNSAS
jgi:subtilase family serine protease